MYHNAVPECYPKNRIVYKRDGTAIEAVVAGSVYITGMRYIEIADLFTILHQWINLLPMNIVILRRTLYRLILIAITTGIASAQQEVDQMLADASIKIEQEQYNEALILVDKALAVSPDNITVLEKKINILYLQDELKDAMQLVEGLLKQQPLKPEYYYLRAVTHMFKQKYVKALDDFKMCVQLKIPERYMDKIYLSKGMAHYYLGEFTVAESSFSQAISLNPESSVAYHSRGLLKYEIKEYDEALKDFTLAYQLEEDNIITAFNLGLTYFRLQENENACYYFNKSCSNGNRNACKMLMMECAQELKLSQ
jgi:tetratricopeptide (TPR) repeat protein